MAGWIPRCPSALWSPGAPQTPRWCIRPPHPRLSLCSRTALYPPCQWPHGSAAQKSADPAWPAGWRRSLGSRGSRPLAALACGAARPRCRSPGSSARPKNIACVCVMLLVSDTTTSARFQESLQIKTTRPPARPRAPVKNLQLSILRMKG
jgi:hypothetical protein